MPRRGIVFEALDKAWRREFRVIELSQKIVSGDGEQALTQGEKMLTERRMTTAELIEGSSIHPRDLVALSASSFTAVLQPREGAIIVALAHVRAVIFPRRVMLFKTKRHSLTDLAGRVYRRLRAQSQPATMWGPAADSPHMARPPFELEVLEVLLMEVARDACVERRAARVCAASLSPFAREPPAPLRQAPACGPLPTRDRRHSRGSHRGRQCVV